MTEVGPSPAAFGGKEASPPLCAPGSTPPARDAQSVESGFRMALLFHLPSFFLLAVAADAESTYNRNPFA